MAKTKKISADTTPAKASQRETATQLTDEVSEISQPQPELPKYKDESNAFNIPVEDDEDYVSTTPSEILDRILGYCLMDHEREIAVRQKEQGANFTRNPHVLLSLAAMSKHFSAHVESFSRREMMRNRKVYRFFQTNDEIVEKGGLRRSFRLKAKPAVDPRCYRRELVKHLQTWCLHCGWFTEHFATMANSVGCHQRCEHRFFPKVIDLTTALRNYDLRDWMIIKTREPGPRTKKIELPTIHYGTVRTGTRFFLGLTTSYRFYDKDVQSIAKIVHGDVEKHMASKQEKRAERSAKKRQVIQRGLKIQYHADLVEAFNDDLELADLKDHHQERLTHYTSQEYDPDLDSDIDELEYEHYGEYSDIHRKLCTDKANCEFCWETTMRKYHDWFW